MKVLVTGGVRSGKSRHAESLLSDAPFVTYVAPGPSADEDPDPDWVARIAAHQARRPLSWRTIETRDLAPALRREGPLLVDCLGTWLTGVLDSRELWDAPSESVTPVVHELLEQVVAVLSGRDDVVLVTNEVGLGVVPAHRSGRVFRDLLGLVNQQIATACDEVHLVIAGRVLRL
ncbi:MAG: bifunctional adenosylcobinamide kinase/adenosylcobinamide-phosphate guanylyltransferase [Nocardioides sp.]|jgi:adenosylcobinamide kinase/adenosylcobinamide-phosphate guanylyltransferase|uniref:bifunctional adenosylcobinamide kinase/adenosylcobinamide-phosphate guanylyltransferase n=1 Tax=Nocardioides sp. TaxID=35761 RepID=UPI0026310ACC|nr:bifunctional adenosylcobinamide kinase/adenosylcobinamide-phosphate guanylyltransferase [Nocardioides sp.]MCW2835837.1 bifunctional adenosylcobinamide kinase/adenosylcobinamide-phosphate guanylyltransferase [Nocardioides sp.]